MLDRPEVNFHPWESFPEKVLHLFSHTIQALF